MLVSSDHPMPLGVRKEASLGVIEQGFHPQGVLLTVVEPGSHDDSCRRVLQARNVNNDQAERTKMVQDVVERCSHVSKIGVVAGKRKTVVETYSHGGSASQKQVLAQATTSGKAAVGTSKGASERD
ncbi:hypothetical protein IHE45_10G082300 [Dioscorea alata]|uniref:Uncharacterized protein n=1 Tax=Dioscorea alata TaxID=55571 RepID=A0ACB7VC72_DIOAL|nr:hypothetical protein IHE45_10G082300 [Dioscorea alata]